MKDWRNEPKVKVCRHCSVEFIGKYNSSACQECKREVKVRISRDFKKRNPGYWREWQKSERGVELSRKNRLSSYGLSIEDYDRMLDDQNGCCAICMDSGGWKANGGNLVIDHCHDTGEVRGLLCPSCNRGLGQFRDCPEILEKAAWYIQREIAKRKGGV